MNKDCTLLVCSCDKYADLLEPSFKIRLIEGLKAFIFAIVPTTLLVRVQNAVGIGAREKAHK